MTELLRADNLTRHFKIGGTLSRRTLHAVDDVTFTIGEREIVALAGESGSGKSTVARLLARVYRPTSGQVTWFGGLRGVDPPRGGMGGAEPTMPGGLRGVVPPRGGMGGAEPTMPGGLRGVVPPGQHGKPVRQIRSRKAALAYSARVPMVFQDPFSSLNPVFRVSHGVLRALKLHRPELSRQARQAEAERVFEVVGLGADMLQRYPHELSGGQRQRVGFAQALATKPKLILADEPVSMLDVSIRIGLLNLMMKLRDEEGVSILYITHDIASARYVADRLIVMYAGQIAEAGPIEDVLADPRHPYTQLLLSAVPDPKAPPPSLAALAAASGEHGEPPKVIDPAPGCRFQSRCPVAIDACATITPELLPLGGSDPPQTPPAHGGLPAPHFPRAAPHSPRREVACHVAQAGAEVKAFT